MHKCKLPNYRSGWIYYMSETKAHMSHIQHVHTLTFLQTVFGHFNLFDHNMFVFFLVVLEGGTIDGWRTADYLFSADATCPDTTR